MATDDKKELNMKVMEFRGQDAKDLMEKLGLKFDPAPPVDEKPWTKKRMVTAFGSFIDDNIGDFAHDMSQHGMTEADIFEAIQVAMAHNLGCVERARSFIHDSKEGQVLEGPRDEDFLSQVQKLSKKNVEIGWDHKNTHLTRPAEKCVDPYKVYEGTDENPPSAA